MNIMTKDEINAALNEEWRAIVIAHRADDENALIAAQLAYSETRAKATILRDNTIKQIKASSAARLEAKQKELAVKFRAIAAENNLA
jgi:hypothetical protein